MEDRFAKVTGEFLRPIEDLRGRVSDSVYFLGKRGYLAFSEGYCHPPQSVYGQIIKYPKKGGRIVIHGRAFDWTHRRYENGELVIVPYAEQRETNFEVEPALDPSEPVPVFAENLVRFPLDCFRGYFDNVHSLRVHMERIPRVREIVTGLSDLFSFPAERLGTTGSMAYGLYEEPAEDIDLVFHGTVEENRSVVEKIKAYLRENEPCRVVELGKLWPIRFFYRGILICPFFKYLKEEEIPLKEMEMEVLREPVRASGTVADDTHSVYFPCFLPLEKVELDGEGAAPLPLVLYDGAQRGEYFRGDRLDLEGRLVRVTSGSGSYEALLNTNFETVRKL